MTPCTFVLTTDTPCGRAAVAVWEHPVTGLAFLCSEHDRKARDACNLDPQLLLEWDRLPLATSDPRVAGTLTNSVPA